MAASSRRLADGTYKKYGLDVTIVPGGPNTNNRILLTAGKLDFFMSANTLQSFDAVTNNVPLVAVAAIFQKDPQVFLTHPETKITKLEEPQAADAAGVQGRRRELLPVAEVRIRLQREQGETLHLQFAALHREQAERDAGLCHLRALRRREGGGLQAGRDPARRSRFQRLFDPDRDPPRDRRQEARPGAALRRCFRDRLVQLSLSATIRPATR